jgi:hypothetical protein
MVKSVSPPEQKTKKLPLVETQALVCKTNQQKGHLKNTEGKVNLYNWKAKYLKLYKKYKKLKEVYEFSRHLP